MHVQDALLLYYQKFTGNLTGALPAPGQSPSFVPGSVLLFEQPGPTEDTTWPHVRAAAGAHTLCCECE